MDSCELMSPDLEHKFNVTICNISSNITNMFGILFGEIVSHKLNDIKTKIAHTQTFHTA